MLFYEVLLCLLLLYKRLPRKVTLLSFVLNVYFIGLQLYSERKLYSSTSLISTTALHIEIISLVDGTYELIQDLTEDNKDLNMNPESESELHEVQPTSRN